MAFGFGHLITPLRLEIGTVLSFVVVDGNRMLLLLYKKKMESVKVFPYAMSFEKFIYSKEKLVSFLPILTLLLLLSLLLPLLLCYYLPRKIFHSLL